MILPIGGIALLAIPKVLAAKGPRPDIKSQRKPTLKPSAQPHPDPSEEDLTSDHEEQEVFIVRERLKSRARSRRKRTFQLAYARGPADRGNVPLDREIMPYKRSSENVPI